MRAAAPTLTCVLFAALLSGCAGLPSKPAPVRLADSLPLGALAAPRGGWPSSHWWRRYRDPTLDRLVAMALASSPSLASAHARFDSARQGVRIAAAASGARVDFAGDLARQRLSNHGLIPASLLGFAWYNQADLGLQARYTFDWWGKQRDLVEAAADRARVAQAERSAAALALASAVTDSYFGWQADQSRLVIARAALNAAERTRAIAVARVRAGLDPAEEVSQGDIDVAAARGRIAALRGSANLRVVALAALIGRPRSTLPVLAARPLPRVALRIPRDVRIDLLARRPDIAASRWLVDAAQSRSASARADFLPDISIDALAGLSSVDIGKLLQYGSRDPLASVALHLPIFDSGMLRARYGVTRAQLHAAVDRYDQTLIAAARDVATQAASLEALAAERAEQRLGVEAARRLYVSATALVRQGLSDRRGQIEAQLRLLEQRDRLVQLDAAALTADAALQTALGGGYGGTPAPAKPGSTVKKPNP
ncbi:MAG: efflux transporter outer membrane subunit [Steroidobacteraceae bacterium]|nr:efflux transporter outer membrane subunit [Steroidobacteraceae bacterium]